MRTVTVAFHAVRLRWVVSWRELVGRIGGVAAAAIVVCGIGGIVGIQWWLYPSVANAIEYVVSSELSALVFPGLLAGFLLLCMIVRVMALAFSSFSSDVATVLMSAPLTRTSKALVQIVPDLAINIGVSSAIGSLGLLAFSLHDASVSLLQVAFLECTCVIVVGSVASVIQLGMLKTVGDEIAARAGAAVTMMLLGCTVMFGLYGSLEDAAGRSSLARIEAFLMRRDPVVGVLGGAVIVGSLMVWGVSRSELTSAGLRAVHRSPAWTCPGSSLLITAMKSFGRDSENRLGILCMGLLCALGMLMERVSHVPIAELILILLVILSNSSCGLSVYGGFLPVRWSVVCSPRRLSVAFLQWLAGYLVSGLIVSVALVFCVLSFNAGTLEGLGFSQGARCLGVSLVSMACGLIAGRLIPVKKGDLVSMAASGLLCTVLLSVSVYSGRGLSAILVIILSVLLLLGSSVVVALSVAGRDER